MSSVAYLDAAAASDVGRAYKARLVELLDPAPGQTVLDVGCGPGTDLGALVSFGGTVIGVDTDASMLVEARRRVPSALLYVADAHALPLPDASVDRARADRVVQHLADPARAVAELYRVVRPGGRVTLSEPDWHTVAIDSPDLATSLRFAAFLASRVRNAAMGRQLARLATDAGFLVATVLPLPVLFRDFDTAEQILGLRRTVDRAVEAGALPADRAHAWLDGLEAGPSFVATFTHFLVVAVRPGTSG